jgi:hypothetical protein
VQVTVPPAVTDAGQVACTAEMTLLSEIVATPEMFGF